jgi:tetratricopeptide (TPR) repeat protein
MLYGGALTFWARRRLALARYLFLEMQGEWRVNGLLCTPASAITAASVFLVGGCPAEAVKQLESAIQKFPLVDGTPLLQPSLGKLLLSLGKTAEAKHVVVELRALKPDAYLGVLAAVHCDVTEEQGLERAIECLRAEKERIPATLSARGRADETAQIEAQIFVLQHQLGEIRGHDCGAQATMQGLYGLARVQALCAVGKKDDALSALNDLLLKGDSPSLTDAPNLAYLPDLTAYAGLFELKGSPAWEAFLVRSGLAEIASRDLWIRPDTAQAA